MKVGMASPKTGGIRVCKFLPGIGWSVESGGRPPGGIEENPGTTMTTNDARRAGPRKKGGAGFTPQGGPVVLGGRKGGEIPSPRGPLTAGDGKRRREGKAATGKGFGRGAKKPAGLLVPESSGDKKKRRKGCFKSRGEETNSQTRGIDGEKLKLWFLG